MSRRISWAITMHCNNNIPCGYCVSESNNRIPHPTLEDAMRIVDKINALGSWEIYINGGEPFSLPGFNDAIVPGLLNGGNRLFVTTNFTYSNDTYKKFADTAGDMLLKLNLSYHIHLFPDYKLFAEKIKKLISLGCSNEKIVVSAVLHPKHLDEIKELDAILTEELGIYLYPQLIKERKNGSIVSFKYDDEQMEIIQSFEKSKSRKSFLMETSNIECWAGTNYLFVTPDGKAFRCQQYYYSKKDIGNLKDLGFTLLNQARKCDYEFCSCGSAQEVCIKTLH